MDRNDAWRKEIHIRKVLGDYFFFFIDEPKVILHKTIKSF